MTYRNQYTYYLPFSGMTYNPVSTSDRGLIHKQEDIIKMQDDMILDIESGVDRLHEKAKVIGQEAKSHTRLLDDLDTNVEIATAALHVCIICIYLCD